MEKKYILISMEDNRAKKLSDVFGNKTCKKIIDLLAEKESSEKDIADALNIPINTAEYNLKKLMQAELIEKAKNFFWSKKGKKINLYRLSNKSIIISPKTSRVSSKLKSILPVFILTAAGTFAIWVYENIKVFTQTPVADLGVGGAANELMYKIISPTSTLLSPQSTPVWAWFLAGALLAIFIITILNWRKL